MRYLLLAAAVLATMTVVVSGEFSFEFYKLSLQWPPSTCSNPMKTCRGKIPDNFTIHGLWPQHADDTPVRPYEEDRRCTNKTPKTADDITPQLFGRDMLKKLDDNWPDLFKRSNLGFWKGEWAKHGMCSDYPTDPKSYFSETLKLAKKYNPLNQLKDRKIQPGDTDYNVSQVVEAIRAKWRVKPQIACYAVTHGGKKIHLLWEIRFCLNKDKGKKPFGLRDCPKTVDVCTSCKSEDFVIRFPISPVPRPEIIRESVLEYTDEL